MLSGRALEGVCLSLGRRVLSAERGEGGGGGGVKVCGDLLVRHHPRKLQPSECGGVSNLGTADLDLHKLAGRQCSFREESSNLPTVAMHVSHPSP